MPEMTPVDDAHAALHVNELDVEAVLFKKARILGNPERRCLSARRGVADTDGLEDILRARLIAEIRREQNQRGDRRRMFRQPADPR